MKHVRRVAAMRALVRDARRRGKSVGFVPTMGALHEGHLSLVRRARRAHDRVVVSVFVNPLQFGPKEDFRRYPRNERRDAALCRGAGCDWFFRPSVEEIYPEGFQTSVLPGPLASRWEGAVRPGHFGGVLTVVLKLLQAVEPDTLYLGQKDAQQAAVVGAMMRDFALPSRLSVAPIVREPDGLAMSSRNAYLGPEERARAAGFPRALAAAAALARRGVRDTRRLEAEAKRVLQLEAKPDAIDYVAVVDPETLEPIRRLTARGLILGAIRVGRTRLIDNRFLTPDSGTRGEPRS
ncbi:MAG TPA: pantoate--beta-alanine ligase [Candidatus Eisenbacteria bacterium]|nr:pantoate--beta-alanine ligase [Candidatus Eisenbacteria bacterium]